MMFSSAPSSLWMGKVCASLRKWSGTEKAAPGGAPEGASRGRESRTGVNSTERYILSANEGRLSKISPPHRTVPSLLRVVRRVRSCGDTADRSGGVWDRTGA
jgi:hypothetical protein